MMRTSVVLVSVAVLALYGFLAFSSPSYALFSPRGGAFTLGVSLLLANAAIWLSQQPHRALNERFQLVVAAWIWLLVQLGCILYLVHMVAA